MGDYSAVNADGAMITLTAGAVITGGLLVTLSADDTVVHSTSSTLGTRPVGVAGHDAPSGGRVSIWLIPGYLHELPVENGVTPTTGQGAVASTTPGRITSVALTAITTTQVGAVIGTFVRCTTGSLSATVRSRILGF